MTGGSQGVVEAGVHHDIWNASSQLCIRTIAYIVKAGSATHLLV